MHCRLIFTQFINDTQADRRRRGIENWTLEIFRINKVNEINFEDKGEEDRLSAGNRNREIEDCWDGRIGRISTSSLSNLNIDNGVSTIATHPIALHSIDSTALTHTPMGPPVGSGPPIGSGGRGRTVLSSNEESSPLFSPSYPSMASSRRLFAYGGAAGLLRIHSLDLLKEMVP